MTKRQLGKERKQYPNEKKRIFWFLAFVTALIALLTVSASATTYRGSCGKDGDNLIWTFDTGTGELAITGTGEMKGWTSSSRASWYSYRSNIKTVSIGNGVTSIGDYAFDDCSALTSITIPNTKSPSSTQAEKRSRPKM